MSAPGLENGLFILEYILNNKKAGFNQLKNELGLSPASLNRYLKVLLNKNFLDKLENGQYVIGTSLQKYTINQSSNNKLDKFIYPFLQKISQTLQFTSLWISYENGKMICKEKYLYPHGVVLQQTGEIRTDFIMNPWGFIFLAHCSKQALEFYINHTYSKDKNYINIPTKKQITDFIDDFNKKGYLSDKANIFNHLVRVAVPVYDENMHLIASVVIGGMDSVLTEEKISEYIPFIKKEINMLPVKNT